MKTFRTAVVFASLLLVVAGGARIGANTFYPATVTFSDRAGDNITSDYLSTGNHTFVNGGTDKLESGFWVVPNNDFVLRARTGPSPRYLVFAFTPITPLGAPTGSLNERNIFMNINNILAMPTGTAKNAGAVFTTAVGSFKFTRTWVVDTTTYATKVFVSRSGNVWTVTADLGVPPEPGDVAGLTQTKKNTEQLVGLYHMPFQATITCQDCP